MADLPRPTDAELEILQVLWLHGPCSVRQVHDTLRAARDTGYTTTLKQLQIMTEKGLVRRIREGKAHIYEAAVAREATQHRLLGDFLSAAFRGSAADLVLHTLGGYRPSTDELARIREFLDGLPPEPPAATDTTPSSDDPSPTRA